MIKVDYSIYRRQQLEFASGLIKAARHALDVNDGRYDALTGYARKALSRTEEDRLPAGVLKTVG